MRPAGLASTLFVLSAVLVSPAVIAQPVEAPTPAAPRDAWAPTHPLALGARLVGRAGDYALAGVGGHLRVRPHRLLAIDLFTDHFAGTQDGALRHDHEVGGTLQLTALQGPRWTLYPLLGACAVLAVVHSPQPGGPSTNDISFGLRAGLGGEYALGGGFSLQAQAEAVAYLGHELRVYRWSAEVAPELGIHPVGQLTVAANYYF